MTASTWRWQLAGGLSAVASLVHVAIMAGGPAWCRFFGADERMAVAAENGRLYPGLITLCIAVILAGWSVYALSGAVCSHASYC